ncbi:hypothetical protein LCGC14_2892090 [marine sediment metagenome]|uniref:Uncharacterized protein n=1 Tax=marine sediment metagenome TaxID=412755 RepID=A0A0F8XWY1_9ZZZZ
MYELYVQSKAYDVSVCLGGAKRDRTADLLRARQALSQLSYGPDKTFTPRQLVGLGRFELPTSPLSGVRSNQLSYRPNYLGLLPGGPVDSTSPCLVYTRGCGNQLSYRPNRLSFRIK